MNRAWWPSWSLLKYCQFQLSTRQKPDNQWINEHQRTTIGSWDDFIGQFASHFLADPLEKKETPSSYQAIQSTRPSKKFPPKSFEVTFPTNLSDKGSTCFFYCTYPFKMVTPNPAGVPCEMCLFFQMFFNVHTPMINHWRYPTNEKQRRIFRLPKSRTINV